MIIGSTVNENHNDTYRKSGNKNVQAQAQRITQQAVQIRAGGNFSALVGGDLALVASQLKAGDEAYLVAGGKVQLLAEQDYDYSFSEKKKKGSWGSKSLKSDEHTRITHIGSEIRAGGDLLIVSGDEQRYQAAKLNSGADLTLDSGAGIVFEGVKDLEQESHIRSQDNWAWQSAKGKGHTDETLIQSQLQAQGELVIRAAERIQIDIKEVNQQSISQTIDAMVQADPQLAWLKEVEQRGDVDWRQVKELHDSFKYSSSSMSGPLAIVIAIIVTYFTAGAASGLVAGAASGAGATTVATGTMWAAGTGASLAGAGWANIAVTTALTGMASNTAIGTINNKGDLGAGLKDATTSDALKGYVVSGVTAGLTAGVYDKWTGTQTGASNTAAASNNTGVLANSGKVAVEGGLSTWSGVGQFAANQALQNGTSAVLNKALGQDGSLGDALTSTLANTFAAAGFNWVGDFSQNNQINNGSLTKIGLHAIMGGLAAEAAGGDFKIGALAAGANEALIDTLANQYDNMSQDQRSGLLVMNSQVLGVLVASMAGGDEKDMQIGASVAGNATKYNFLGHQELDEFEEQARKCETNGNCDQVKDDFRRISVALDDELNMMCGFDLQGCVALYGDLVHDRLSMQERIAGLSTDSDIPWRLRADLHVFQLQNMSAAGTLIQTQTQLSLEEKGYSSEKAAITAAVLATLASGGAGVKRAKTSPIPTPTETPTSNGFVYKSNGKHTLGEMGNRPNAGIEPKNSLSLFENSVPSSKQYPNKNVRYTLDDNGSVHRFEGTNGIYHWNGSTGDIKNPLNGTHIPIAIQKKLGVRVK